METVGCRGNRRRARRRSGALTKIQFTDTKLKNGLRVIVSEDHAAPVFTIVVNYNVGSRDERKGRTGFAHLFEHMMFKGSVVESRTATARQHRAED
jgi:predicted Zn-dependent peptidase